MKFRKLFGTIGLTLLLGGAAGATEVTKLTVTCGSRTSA